MKKSLLILGLSIFCLASGVCKKAPAVYSGKSVENPEKITFLSKDGVTITADVYMAYDKDAPLILCGHRENWSRGEYREIAPKLNKDGFNVIAIDQRSGNIFNGVQNETNLSAKEVGVKINPYTSIEDINSSIDYVYKNYAKDKIIFWGSSYSGSLGLSVINTNKKVKGILVFSPGEYFAAYGKNYGWVLGECAKNKKIPVWVTCEKMELKDVQKIYDAVACPDKTFYNNVGVGSKHGSEALFSTTVGNEEMYAEVLKFLKNL